MPVQFSGMLYTATPYDNPAAHRAYSNASEALRPLSVTGSLKTQAALDVLDGTSTVDPKSNYYDFRALKTREDEKSKVKKALNQLVDADLPFAYVPHADRATSLNTLMQTRFLMDDYPAPENPFNNGGWH